MRTRAFVIILSTLVSCVILNAQVLTKPDSVPQMTLSTGWADEAVTTGYVTAPSALALMFVASLVNEWNAAYVGIPAAVMILAAPPLIYAGGRSVEILKEISHPRAKLGWTLYALSLVPTSLAIYSFSQDWGSTVPLTIASAIFGSASIVAMTSYAHSRAKTARNMVNNSYSSLGFGIVPLKGGAMATLSYRF
ncbi:MAG: hypothetical protein ABFS28_03110 [Bacteroidota bacterium]